MIMINMQVLMVVLIFHNAIKLHINQLRHLVLDPGQGRTGTSGKWLNRLGPVMMTENTVCYTSRPFYTFSKDTCAARAKL